MAKFEVGKIYTARSVCDSECVFQIRITSRTEKTVTAKTMHGDKRCKIHIFDGVESVFALGQYSMAPIFRAGQAVAS